LGNRYVRCVVAQRTRAQRRGENKRRAECSTPRATTPKETNPCATATVKLARARKHGARSGHVSDATRAGLPLLVCVLGRRPSPLSPAPCNHHQAPPPPPHCHHGEHNFLAPLLLCSHPPRLLPRRACALSTSLAYSSLSTPPLRPPCIPFPSPRCPAPAHIIFSIPLLSRLAHNRFPFPASFSTVFSSSVQFSVALRTLLAFSQSPLLRISFAQNFAEVSSLYTLPSCCAEKRSGRIVYVKCRGGAALGRVRGVNAVCVGVCVGGG